MKQVCLLCQRSAADKNLYCQETACPAEVSPLILQHGEFISDIEIVKPVTVLKSAVLYEALRQKERVYLKVAHPGPEHTERLKREALFLRDMHKQNSPYLPALLPPRGGTTIARESYGKAKIENYLLYYYLFEYVPGESLTDLLSKRPQPWVFHCGWIMVSIASAVALLQSKGLLHLALNPDSVLVYIEGQPGVPRVKLIDFGILTDSANVRNFWYRTMNRAGYTAPELADHLPTGANYSTDVYGLGLILYELLGGQPAFPARGIDDTAVLTAVRRGERVALEREDVPVVAAIAQQSLSLEPAQRQQSATAVADQLTQFFGEVPPPKHGFWPPVEYMVAALILLAAIAFVITSALNIFVPTLPSVQP